VKLSILIAATDETRLETSLVSVLENRPSDCQVVVIHDEGYSDPYALAGEVRFVFVPSGSDELARLSAGLQSCQAPLLHILRCGATVSEGWTDAAIAHFTDPRIAAVSPLVIAADRSGLASAGIEYRLGGRRIVRAVSAQTADGVEGPTPILGPSLDGAFYRLAALCQLGEAFSPAVGDELVDVDVALRLARRGYRAVLEPKSRVVAAEIVRRRHPLSDAWLAERLFWRHARDFGLLRSMASHATLVAAEAASSFAGPLQAGCVIGRAAGLVEQILFGKRTIAGAAQRRAPRGDRSHVRVDAPEQCPAAKRSPRRVPQRAA
jgi:hypothetical protein